MQEAQGLVALPRAGDTIDRHVVVGEIARGGMAAVFAVRRQGVGGFEKLLALKMILPHLAGERHFVEMFLDEARLASQIDHPNVCRVLDVGTHRTAPYLLMELVHGRSLAAIEARAAGVSLDETARIAFWLGVLAQAAEGLHAAHEARGADGESLGIVHRDVSPQNVLVGLDGRVRVVDFGIAAGRGRLVGTRTGEIKGKLAYMAPEQIQRDQAIGRATDVWGLGVVAWELLAGRPLFKDAEEARVLWSVMSARVPNLAREAPGLPAEAARIVMQCLERDATQRPTDAREVARALAEAAVEVGGRALDPVARAAEMMARLFPDPAPAWSQRSDVSAAAPSSERDQADSPPTRAEKPGRDDSETATLALSLAAATPRAAGVLRWLGPTLALVAAVLAGAAISRSSSSSSAGGSARVDDRTAASAAAQSTPSAFAGSVAAPIAPSASPQPSTGQPAPRALRSPAALPSSPAVSRPTSAARPSAAPPASPTGDERSGGPLMSNPF